MTVTDTSREAFKQYVQPKLSDKQVKVYTAIQMMTRPVCNQELSDYLGEPINQITPRTGELVGKGKVELAFKAKYPKTGIRVSYWQAVEKNTIAI